MLSFSQKITSILSLVRSRAERPVNFIVVEAYLEVGHHIVEEEQQGAHRAEYGSNMIRHLAKYLTKEQGNGFSVINLKYLRQIYVAFPNRHALCDQLSWTHYRSLLRVENPQARQLYLEEGIVNNYSVPDTSCTSLQKKSCGKNWSENDILFNNKN